MKALLLPFQVAQFLLAKQPASRAITEEASEQPVTTSSPSSRQQYVPLLALACLYPVIALVGCWLLFEAIQHFLVEYFSQLDSITLHGPR
jgi:hypothetical protein